MYKELLELILSGSFFFVKHLVDNWKYYIVLLVSTALNYFSSVSFHGCIYAVWLLLSACLAHQGSLCSCLSLPAFRGDDNTVPWKVMKEEGLRGDSLCTDVSLWTRIVSAASAKVISPRWLLSTWGRLLLILQDPDQTASLIFHVMPSCALPDTKLKWLYLPRVHTSFHNFSYVCVVRHGYACVYVCGVHMHIHAWGPMVMFEIFLDHAFMVSNEVGSLK